MKWTYKTEEISEMSEFPDNTFGFVYMITHIPSGKAYIGKKVLFHNRKVKLGKKELAEYAGVVGRRPSYKLAIKESDWKTYWGSNKPLLSLIKEEPIKNFERYVICCCSSKKQLTYFEIKYQMIYQVLEKPEEFFNDNILGKFFTRDLE